MIIMRTTISCTLCLFLLIAFTHSVFAQQFEEHIITSNYNQARNVDVADLDGDGDMDFVSASYGGGLVSWWENNGNQSFTSHTIESMIFGAIRVRCADMDNDGDIDVIGAAYTYGQLYWWENDGDGDFTSHYVVGAFYRPRSVCAADVNSDGVMDLLSCADTNDYIMWWENPGSANYTIHVLDTSVGYPYCITAGDIDEDGDTDLLGVANSANQIILYLNNGPDDFDEQLIVNNYMGAREAMMYDLDLDGDLDIIGSSWGLGELRWWEHDGDLGFTEHLISDQCSDIQSFGVGDFNSDGSIDIVSASPEGDIVQWWENDGNQTFTNHVINNNFDHATHVCVVDLDGDFDLDIIGTAYNDNTIAWWENLCPTHLPTPFNLESPEDNEIVSSEQVHMMWEESVDPDPDNELSYELWIYPDSTLENGIMYTSAETGVNEIIISSTNLEENHLNYYWNVFATDDNTDGRWSNQTWKFSTNFVEETPSEFSLIAPVDNTEFTPEEGQEVPLEWGSSTDPDIGQSVTYHLVFSITAEGMDDSELSYSGYTDTLATINIPDSLGLEVWYSNLNVSWYVEAISLNDSVMCTNPSSFIIEGYDAVSEDLQNSTPNEWAIHSVYPNPFNPSTTICMAIPEAGQLDLRLFNIYGQEVATIAHGYYSAGYRNFTLNGNNLSSGVYFVHATSPHSVKQIRKVLLVR